MENEEKGLLEFLLRDGVTPSFSFPLDVCEFKVEGLTDENGNGYRPKTWAKMGQDLRKALVEYSPGREIVVNGEAYVIGGLSFFNPPNLIHQARHVFENRLEVIDYSTNGTTFPLGNECAEVLAILADVVTIKLSWPLSYQHRNNPDSHHWTRYESKGPSD